MTVFIQACLKNIGVVAVVLLGLFLIAASILKNAGLDQIMDLIEARQDNKAVADIPLPPPIPALANAQEVSNYVLFTKVDYGDQNVTTGVRYDSSGNQEIVKQWCYLSSSNIAGVSSSLSLAEKLNTGVMTTTPFTRDALAKFDLTNDQAKSLVETHCRFQ